MLTNMILNTLGLKKMDFRKYLELTKCYILKCTEFAKEYLIVKYNH